MDKITELLTRRVAEIYPSRKSLEKVLRSGKKLRVYQGFDPTSSHLHLGHTIGLRKLMEFANLGHEVIFLFGDATVLVGDPSERENKRKLITKKEVEKNASCWLRQIKPIVDLKKIKIKHNKDWLLKLNLEQIIKIGSHISAVQLFKRDNFQRRIKKGDTVFFHETMYPLLQGYDSVALNVDLEVGGTDQMFNMLIGRELVRKILKKEKFVMTTKMILGTDGQKMSKSSGNCIYLEDTAEEFYRKIMQIDDSLIPDYYEFFTQIPLEKIKKMKESLKRGKINPLQEKKRLALAITSQFHGKNTTLKAQMYFEKVFQKKETPTQIKKASLAGKPLIEALVSANLVNSNSEAKRLLRQKGIKLNQKILSLKDKNLILKSGDIISLAQKKWLKIK